MAEEKHSCLAGVLCYEIVGGSNENKIIIKTLVRRVANGSFSIFITGIIGNFAIAKHGMKFSEE